MGKGDKKSKKGKIKSGSYGVSRPHKIKVDKTPKAKNEAEEKKAPAKKKAAPAKKKAEATEE